MNVKDMIKHTTLIGCIHGRASSKTVQHLQEKDLKILNSSSISESPGKRGFWFTISAKMQPTDHTSTGVEYCRAPKRISGALYHSVTTYKKRFGLDYNETSTKGRTRI
jgi:hypothetical protein